MSTTEPRFQPMSQLSDDEYASLKEDIRTNGLIYAIQIDEDGNILDGHNRDRICKELGIPPRYEVQKDLDDEGKWNFALRLNSNRRHLSNEQKAQLVDAELQRNPRRSDVAIARSLGVSASMVGRHRREMEADAKRAEWTPQYRDAVEKMIALTREQVAGWGHIADVIVAAHADYPDDFASFLDQIGMDEYESSMLFHEIESCSWDKHPSLPRTYQKLAPFREQMTHGITFTHENGWSDHPTPIVYDETTDSIKPASEHA